jgi:16S rRNA (cytidine1402-2'-O)-methyltransferase
LLTLVPTPIGNLEDISLRSIEAIKQSDIILCEDTRVSSKLLNLLSQRLDIDFGKKDYICVHSHNEEKFILELDISFFDKNIIYLSDAGMPCISDPGSKLVDFCIKNSIDYDVIPGANAILLSYAMSGFDFKEFTFYGFLPHKSINRKKELEKIFNSEYLVILYEAPHRLLQLFDEMSTIDNTREVFVAKELTKKFQNYFKGTISKVHQDLKNSTIKGEWVVIIAPNLEIKNSNPITIDDLMSLDVPKKQLAKLLAKSTNRTVKECYNELIVKK